MLTRVQKLRSALGTVITLSEDHDHAKRLAAAALKLDDDNDSPRVHILHAGRPLCGKPGTPSVWGEDHRWVYRHSRDCRSLANCAECLEVEANTGDILDRDG